MEYKELEGLLFNYKNIKTEIKLNQIKLENLKKEDGITGISYKEATSKTNKIHSITENTAISNMDIEERLKKKIKLDENKIRIADNLLKGIDETERRILELYYIEDWPWWKVAEDVCFSVGWCKAKRRDTINKILSYL